MKIVLLSTNNLEYCEEGEYGYIYSCPESQFSMDLIDNNESKLSKNYNFFLYGHKSNFRKLLLPCI